MTEPAEHHPSPWPAIPFSGWRDTHDTLHRWLQIVGKVRLALSPWVNHSWTATLYVTARGLTTSPIPYGRRTFQVDLDFLSHRLHVHCSDGRSGGLELRPRSVAAFHDEFLAELRRLELPVRINGAPNEVPEAVPFARDHEHRAYDATAVTAHWRALAQADRVLQRFRGRFTGKCSPVHYFWGAPDLAVTRFSGRPAPPHPGGVPGLPDRVVREAYSREVSSAGFWAGGGTLGYPAFYSYAYPGPPGFADARVRPAEAFHSAELGEFILPYDAVRESADPDATLLEFLQSTYEAAATLGGWDRAALENVADPRRPPTTDAP